MDILTIVLVAVIAIIIWSFVTSLFSSKKNSLIKVLSDEGAETIKDSFKVSKVTRRLDAVEELSNRDGGLDAVPAKLDKFDSIFG
jgi:hypothetical protein